MQVYAIEQGAGYSRPVALDLIRRAAAGPLAIPQIPAGAGVHGRHQLKAGWISGFVTGPREGDLAGFHGLAQNFKAVAIEFRQFIEKQDTAVGQGNFAGSGFFTATGQSCSAGGMVGAAEWAPEVFYFIDCDMDVTQGKAGQCFLRVRRGQYPGKATGQ